MTEMQSGFRCPDGLAALLAAGKASARFARGWRECTLQACGAHPPHSGCHPNRTPFAHNWTEIESVIRGKIVVDQESSLVESSSSATHSRFAKLWSTADLPANPPNVGCWPFSWTVRQKRGRATKNDM